MRKKYRRALPLLLAVLMLVAVIVTVFAADPITITFTNNSNIEKPADITIVPGEALGYSRFPSYEAKNDSSGNERVFLEWWIQEDNGNYKEEVFPTTQFDENVKFAPRNFKNRVDTIMIIFAEVEANIDWTFYLPKNDDQNYNETALTNKTPDIEGLSGDAWVSGGKTLEEIKNAGFTEDTTFTLEWEITLNWDSYEGAAPTDKPTQIYTAEKEITNLPELDEKYGWSTNNAEYVEPSSGKLSSSTTLYAVLKEQTEPYEVEVTLVYNYPEGIQKPDDLPETTTGCFYRGDNYVPFFPEYDNITKEIDGYTFDGWTLTIADFTPPGGAIIIDNNGSTFPFDDAFKEKSVTATATWTKSGDEPNPGETPDVPGTKYTIIFDLDGGTGTSIPESDECEAGKTYTLPTETPTRSGYTFTGWNDGSKTYPAGATYMMPAADVTFTAQWEKTDDPEQTEPYEVEVTLVYNYPEGIQKPDDLPETTTGRFSRGGNYVPFFPEYDSITREINGYTFDGWTLEIEGYTFNEEAIIDADDTPFPYKDEFKGKSVTATATWTKSGDEPNPGETPDVPGTKYTIIFDLDGGTGTSIPESDECEAGKTYTLPTEAPTRSGYTFTGWNDGSKTYPAGATYTMPAADVTFTAQWKKMDDPEPTEPPAPETFTITFIGGTGATGTAPTVSAKPAGTTFMLPANTFTRFGYTFAGWNDGSKTYAAGATYKMPAKNVIFTAQWELNQTGGGGGGGGFSSSYTVGNSFGSSANGSWTTDKLTARRGDTVTITAIPNSGYEVGSVTVRGANGNAVTIKALGSNKFSFTMPASNVTVTILFQAERSSVTDCARDSSCPLNLFTDLNASVWYHDGVHYCLETCLMCGIGGGKFDPNGTTSRAMVITLLWNLEGKPVVNYAMNFSDVATGTWYTEAVRWGASNNIISGYNGKYSPNDYITREQLFTMLYNYAQFKKLDVSIGETTSILGFNDAQQVNTWANAALRWVVGSGIVSGVNNNLNPGSNASRAELAALFQHFCEQFVD